MKPKHDKASKTNEPRQMDFLPQRPAYPPELESATEPVVRVEDATWVRLDCIRNPPDAATRRYNDAEWRSQLNSYRVLGIKTAIHVRRVEGGFWLEDGRHRVLGAQALGWRYVKADVDAAGSAASSAVWRWEANARRKADRPIDEAATWHEMMDPKGAAMTQKQVAEWAGVAASTVSRRLRLLELPRELAVRVGADLDEPWLEPVFGVRENPELLGAACKAVLQALERPGSIRSAQDVLQAIAQAWYDARLAVPVQDLGYAALNDPEVQKQLASLGPFKVRVPSRHAGQKVQDVGFLRDVENALRLKQEVHDRLEAEQAAQEAAKDADAKPRKRTVEERVPEQRTRVQLELMARFLPAQVSFPEDLLAEALGRFVAHTSPLMANQDVEAACRALDWPLPEQAPGRLRAGLHLSREAFLKLWRENRPQALRHIAVALYFQARDYQKQLKDGSTAYQSDQAHKEARLPVWLTGKSFEEATLIATQAVQDRDAGFRRVLDGASCDHCDEPATLRKGNVNVCRSEVFGLIDAKTLAVRRLARREQAKARRDESPVAAAPAAAPVTPAGVEGVA